MSPVRLARILALVGLHASRAGQTGRYLSTLPLVALGHAASLADEAASAPPAPAFPLIC